MPTFRNRVALFNPFSNAYMAKENNFIFSTSSRHIFEIESSKKTHTEYHTISLLLQSNTYIGCSKYSFYFLLKAKAYNTK